MHLCSSSETRRLGSNADRWDGGSVHVEGLVVGEGQPMAGATVAGSAVVKFRRALDGQIEEMAWDDVTGDRLSSAAPWRTFRWHDNQQHYSGAYWSATERGHVIYESRLELAHLLFADFDDEVNHIVAQPFLMTMTVDGRVRKHVPDYLLITDTGLKILDVKPRDRLSKPKVRFTFGWTRALVEGRGWRFDVGSEPPTAELDNVRFLSGFRRDWLFDPTLIGELQAHDLHGRTIADACRLFPDHPAPLVRSAIFHLLWRRQLLVDLTRPLRPSRILARREG